MHCHTTLKFGSRTFFFVKHGTHKGINPTEVSLKIFQNGTIFYTMRRHLVLNCEGDLPIFPFDSPMCDFNIESISNTRDQMIFNWVGPNAVAMMEKLEAWVCHRCSRTTMPTWSIMRLCTVDLAKSGGGTTVVWKLDYTSLATNGFTTPQYSCQVWYW